MKQIKLCLNNKVKIKKTLTAAVAVLKRGGVIVYPTDTLYGLGANAFNENAIIKVCEIKKRRRDKPISVIVRDIKMARKIACIDSRVEKMLNKIWPGPITVVLRKKDVIPYALTGGGETVALRIPKSKFILALMEKIDFPITATSANISEERNLLEPEEIVEELGKGRMTPELFINSGKVKKPEPSTIIDLTTPEPRVIRIGVVGKEKMKELFEKFS